MCALTALGAPVGTVTIPLKRCQRFPTNAADLFHFFQNILEYFKATILNLHIYLHWDNCLGPNTCHNLGYSRICLDRDLPEIEKNAQSPWWVSSL